VVQLLHTNRSKSVVLTAGFVLLLGCMLASAWFGYSRIELRMLWEAYTQFDGSNEHIIVTTSRVPRAMIAAAVGACLAVAGALMQALTRNPLASPSVFGVNAGAVMFIVLGIAIAGAKLSMSGMVWLAFAGAGLTALLVFGLSAVGKDGFTPIKLTLAGSAVAAFASAVTSCLMLLDNSSLEKALYWLVGSISGREAGHLQSVVFYMLAGLLIAMLLARSVNLLAMGDDISRGLGQRTLLVKVGVAVSVVLLAGASVSVAGPIAFVGVIIPHLCRYIVGGDHRWLLPYCAVAGAVLLVTADTASRFILMPKEVPVGVMTALLGVPFLVHVARRRSHD